MADLDASILGDDQTIAAIATPLGRGALATIRCSGSAVRRLSQQLLHPAPTVPRRATHCVVRDESGGTLDEVIATLFLGPGSFTGEDMLEISTHGGIVGPVAVLAALLSAGAREATPGEFTRRALLNGKLDIMQAEAIGDLIESRNSAAYQQALRQLDGGLSRRIQTLREQLLSMEALLAYDVDFPEEDDGPIPRERILSAANNLVRALESLLATTIQGRLVHEGALVVLAGAPNVGKSSLFNALLGEARAIVTEVPGTTRDAIEAVLDLPGWPLRLVDTAGMRPTDNLIEQLGIETTARYLAHADLVIACVDSSDEVTGDEIDLLRQHTAAPILAVATKCDLMAGGDNVTCDVAVSALTGEGLGTLLAVVERRIVESRGVPVVDAPVLTRVRHQRAVQRALEELQAFIMAWTDGQLPVSIAAIHVRMAVDALGELIGAVHVDEVLAMVFQNFCVGK